MGARRCAASPKDGTLAEWDDRLTASLIRWIALLPLAAAVLHAAMIGLLRVQLAPRTIWLLSTIAMAVAFVLSAASIFDFVGRDVSQPFVDRVGPWLGGGVGARNFSADLALRLDPLAAVCCVVVTSVALAIYVYVLGRIQGGALAGDQVHRLFALLDLLVGSTLVLLLADNLILFFFGWTGVGVATQLVSAFDFESKRGARAGATAFVLGRVGDLALLASILLLFDGLARAGAPTLRFEGVASAFRLLEGSLVELPLWLGGGGFPVLELVGAGLALAAMTKCGQVPMHFGLFGASQGPASATALVHAATTGVAGAYLLLRCSFLLEYAPQAMSLLAAFGAATILLGSLAAATQLDLLRIAASSTSAGLGFVLVGIGVGAYSTAAFLLLCHAYAKAHWILALGIVQADRRGETDLRRLGGLARSLRWTHAMAALAACAVVGVPPIGSFFAQEELIASVVATGHPGLVGVCFAGMFLLAFALARVHCLVFFGSPAARAEADARPGQDPAGWIQYGLTLLAIMTISVGMLSPAQFWGDLFGIAPMDTIGSFLSETLAGPADPPIEGGLRWQLVAGCVVSTFGGIALALRRHLRAGLRDEPAQPVLALGLRTLRETFFIEQGIDRLVVRPLRGFSRRLLANVVEARVLDRVVVSGGAGIARRVVWTALRRLQSGRIQGYAMLAVMALLLSVLWLTE